MAHHIDRIALPTNSLGTERHLLVHRFGQPGQGQKAYIQASLHADELPGQLVIHHLLPRLIEAETQGRITGEILVVPVANPIGLSQTLLGHHMGRFELFSGHNFNRYYPDLSTRAAELAEGKLGSDAQANITHLRAAMQTALGEITPATDNEFLKLTLMQLALDSDILLDLHCDFEAVMHMYIGEALWSAARDLAGFIGSEATLMAVESGDNPFDEAISAAWWKLNKKFEGRFPVPADACLSVTVELRSQVDVRHDYAARDAAALYDFLVWRGLIMDERKAPPAPPREATLLTATDAVKAHAPGIIVFTKDLGVEVKKGEHIADIVNVLSDDPRLARQPIYAGTDGLLVTRVNSRLAIPGDTIAKIVGREPLAARIGKKLSEA